MRLLAGATKVSHKPTFLQEKNKQTKIKHQGHLYGFSPLPFWKTHLLSLDCPEVATRLEEVRNAKSLVVLVWHCQVWKERIRQSLATATAISQAIVNHKESEWNKMIYAKTSAPPYRQWKNKALLNLFILQRFKMIKWVNYNMTFLKEMFYQSTWSIFYIIIRFISRPIQKHYIAWLALILKTL